LYELVAFEVAKKLFSKGQAQITIQLSKLVDNDVCGPVTKQ
jgi:hypothetical protein